MMRPHALLVVSNRLPFNVESKGGAYRIEKSSGGLVSALLPLLRSNGGTWVGVVATEESKRTLSEAFQQRAVPFGMIPVFLTPEEQNAYYRGFSNEVIWPLFHGVPSRCRFRSSYWKGYRAVNEKFAEAVEESAEESGFIWVHDYHLMLIALFLRKRELKQRLAYFHHIPFPTVDTFEVLPWRLEILNALLQFDSVGFQTLRDCNNFVSCLRRYVSGLRVTRIGDRSVVCAEGRYSVIGAYPVSVDYNQIEAEASGPSAVTAAAQIRAQLANAQVVLGVDRLDYTKGIAERLIAFQTFLESNPGFHGSVTLLQLVVPSRVDIPEYAELKLNIERLVGEINGRYSKPGWIPIHYFYRCVSQSELIGFYKAADVALVTPLKDGMNLVAKEFCASRTDLRGVLVLSEFAGAAEELKCGALLVNPHDTDSAASAIHEALRMDEHDQRMRMHAMRCQIRRHDVFQWARAFEASTHSMTSASDFFEEDHLLTAGS